MPGIVKFSNLWLIFESWLICLFFANNIRHRQTILNIVAVLLLGGVAQSILGLAQYASGGSLGLQIFGERFIHIWFHRGWVNRLWESALMY